MCIIALISRYRRDRSHAVVTGEMANVPGQDLVGLALARTGGDAAVKDAAACQADCLATSPCDDIKKNGPIFRSCLEACAP